MHARSSRNTRIGLAGLAWFLFCCGSAVLVVLDPDGFRSWSHFTWTDREILIGAACYFAAGLGGFILVITRLILPLFVPRPRIGCDVATPLMVIDAQPRYEEFHALQSQSGSRAARVRMFVTILAGVIFFVMLQHPLMRHDGVSFDVAVTIWGVAMLSRVVIPLVRSFITRTRWWSRRRWELVGRHREARRYHVFEDGILMQSSSVQAIVPWAEVQFARLIGNTIGMASHRHMILIPGEMMPTQQSADQLLDLLERKGLLKRPKAALSPQPHQSASHFPPIPAPLPPPLPAARVSTAARWG